MTQDNSQEGLPADVGSSPTDGAGDNQTITPAMIQELVQATRAAQGQANRSQREVAELRALIEARLTTQASTVPEDDPFADIDMTDLSIRTLVSHIKRQGAELAALKTSAQRSDMSATERAQWQQASDELKDYAEAAGVDFASIIPDLAQFTNPGQAYQEGKKLIRTAQKKATKPGPDETKIRAEERERVLKELGLGNDRRSDIGGTHARALTLETYLNMSPMEREQLRLEHPDQIDEMTRRR